MVFNERREWMCRACEVVLGSPHRVRQHVLSCHFQGPLAKCHYCGVFSKTEASLDRHIRRKHKHKRDMERSQWKVTKDKAKAAQSSGKSCQDPDDCPPPPPPTLCKYESANLRLKNIFASNPDINIIESISEKLLKLKENPLK